MRAFCYALALAGVFAAGSPAAHAQDDYGTGVTVQVPRATGPITLDGEANEADWASAPELDMTAFWATYGGVDFPDVVATGRVLWSEGALYVFIRYQDYQAFYFGAEGEAGNNGEHFLVGVDLVREDDDTTDPSFSGWVDNMPNLGPVAYKITGIYGEGDDGITANFGFGDAPVAPVDSGWVAGQIFINNDTFEWGVEMAIYGAEVTENALLGFNIGGSAASEEFAAEAEGDGNYSYYSWQVCAELPPGENRFCNLEGGSVMSDAASFGTLDLRQGLAGEGGTATPGYAIRANTPNPFGASTALVYETAAAGAVELAAYDALGRRVAVLDAGDRAAGAHPATFHASALPAGVYTVRLTVDGAPVATRRVLHTR